MRRRVEFWRWHSISSLHVRRGWPHHRVMTSEARRQLALMRVETVPLISDVNASLMHLSTGAGDLIPILHDRQNELHHLRRRLMAPLIRNRVLLKAKVSKLHWRTGLLDTVVEEHAFRKTKKFLVTASRFSLPPFPSSKHRRSWPPARVP